MPSFTKADMNRFRNARAASIWARGRDICGDEDALVVLRHDIVQECRGVIQREIDLLKAEIQQGSPSDPQALARLQKVHSALLSLIDTETHRKLTR